LRMKREALVLKKRCQFRIHQVIPWHVCKSFLKIPKVETPSSQKIFCSKGYLSVASLSDCLSFVCLLELKRKNLLNSSRLNHSLGTLTIKPAN
jgi:hypothetical protein